MILDYAKAKFFEAVEGKNNASKKGKDESNYI